MQIRARVRTPTNVFSARHTGARVCVCASGRLFACVCVHMYVFACALDHLLGLPCIEDAQPVSSSEHSESA